MYGKIHASSAWMFVRKPKLLYMNGDMNHVQKVRVDVDSSNPWFQQPGVYFEENK